MAAKSTSGRIILPDLTAAQLAAQNPVLKNRQLQFEGDTGKAKRGDGITHWNSLPYVVGTDGKAATVKVGTVSTLQPGQPATVNNSGTENAAVLNFGIPQGQTGSGGAGGGLRFVELSLTGIRDGTLLMSTNYETDASERFYNIDASKTMIGLLESGLYLVMGSFVFYGNKGSSQDNAYIQIFGSDGIPLVTIPMAKGIGFSSSDYYVASVCQILDWENVEAFGFAVWPADTVQNGASPGENNHVTVLKLK